MSICRHGHEPTAEDPCDYCEARKATKPPNVLLVLFVGVITAAWCIGVLFLCAWVESRVPHFVEYVIMGCGALLACYLLGLFVIYIWRAEDRFEVKR